MPSFHRIEELPTLAGHIVTTRGWVMTTRSSGKIGFVMLRDGTGYLFEHRHLWLRSRRQVAIARVRHEVVQAIRDFFYERHFTLVDTPILTGAIGEHAGTLFATEYFDLGKAYLAQTGQLYVEAAAAALGKVYCFGPTFRAEKS